MYGYWDGYNCGMNTITFIKNWNRYLQLLKFLRAPRKAHCGSFSFLVKVGTSYHQKAIVLRAGTFGYNHVILTGRTMRYEQIAIGLFADDNTDVATTLEKGKISGNSFVPA